MLVGNLELFEDLISEFTPPRVDSGGLVCGDLRCIPEGYRLVKLLLIWHCSQRTQGVHRVNAVTVKEQN